MLRRAEGAKISGTGRIWLLVHVKAATCMLPRMQADPALADEAVTMEEGEGFRPGSEGSGEGSRMVHLM